MNLHHEDPFNPFPLQLWIHFYPAPYDGSKTGPTKSRNREDGHRQTTSIRNQVGAQTDS